MALANVSLALHQKVNNDILIIANFFLLFHYAFYFMKFTIRTTSFKPLVGLGQYGQTT